MKTEIKDRLLQISWINRLGTWRRNIILRILRKSKIKELNLCEIKEKYAFKTFQRERPDENKYYVIYENQPQGGLFVYLINVCVQIAYAEHNGYIPVIDMLNFSNNLRNSDQQDINAWELYFKQPGGVGVQDVYGEDNIVFCDEEKQKILYIGDVNNEEVYNDYEIVIDEGKTFQEWYQNEELMHRFQSFWKRNIKYSDFASEYIENQCKKLLDPEKRFLGLLCRGTDYISLQPKGHYIQPTVEMILDKVSEIMKEYRCDFIFCATEDELIYRKLKQYFGERLIGLDVSRVRYRDGYLLSDLYDRQKMNIYKRQLDYLTELELLSRCQCLIAGKTTGSRFLPVMKDGQYEYLFYWELGRYI